MRDLPSFRIQLLQQEHGDDRQEAVPSSARVMQLHLSSTRDGQLPILYFLRVQRGAKGRTFRL